MTATKFDLWGGVNWLPYVWYADWGPPITVLTCAELIQIGSNRDKICKTHLSKSNDCFIWLFSHLQSHHIGKTHIEGKCKLFQFSNFPDGPNKVPVLGLALFWSEPCSVRSSEQGDAQFHWKLTSSLFEYPSVTQCTNIGYDNRFLSLAMQHLLRGYP